MRLQNQLSRADTDAATSYDEIYTQSWHDTLQECEKTLERPDYERALQVTSLQGFQGALDGLITEHPDEQSKKAIALIHPTLDHYETFAQNFVSMMAHPVDTSMMWGLLFLVFNLALRLSSSGPVSPLSRIIRWLEKIGHKLRASNDCKPSIVNFSKVMGDTVEVNKEIIILWLNIIMTFRNEAQGHGGMFTITIQHRSTGGPGRESYAPYPTILDETAWRTLTSIYEAAYQNIDEAVRRIEKVAEMAERQARAITEMSQLQQLLSQGGARQEDATLPCNNLPVAENRQFFGRGDMLKKIDDHLRPADTAKPLSSIALYGLGGIGKTQIALAYAYSKLEELDAVLWIAAQDKLSIRQSFSRVAVDALQLPNAQPQSHQENMVLVLLWLQKTSAKWLLIFDNVDSHDDLDDCWPASRHGAVLVTTRDVLVASLPIDDGLEVNEFNAEDGAKFLLAMAHKRKRTSDEAEVSQEVAKQLGGLPLALNQMAALINARNCSIREFQAMYAKHEQRLHKQRKSGWKYLGYQHSLDTVWEISFQNLGPEASACLGVLSFFSADSVPSEVFTPLESEDLPELLSFCEDELSLGDALEELTRHALLRKNLEQGTFRIHRLVQSEHRARMLNPQEKFEAATKLLLSKLPRDLSNRFDDEEWILYERYIPQALALAGNYNDSQTKPTPLIPNMDFVTLMANAANAIHDNDTTGAVPVFLDTASGAYHKCPAKQRDQLTWAFLQSLQCLYHLCTSEFARAADEMTDGLKIRLKLLDPDDLLVALAYSWLSMAIASQGRYDEALVLQFKAGKILEGPAGEIPGRKLVWGYNTSRNLYCMGRYEEADKLLSESLADAERMESWYLQVYGQLALASLRTRMGRLQDAKGHVDKAKHILDNSGLLSRFSWLSSYCAYRAGDVAMKQGRVADAIEQTEIAAVIGKLVKVPPGILARCTHAYSKALAMDPARREESEHQRQEARRLRLLIPGGPGDLDDESDQAFELLVKMDHR